MLDEKRIRQMTKLAFFEKKEEKNALRIGRYFRSDYIGKELLKNFFLASIGYILVLAVAVLYHIEWLVDEIDTIDLQFAAGCLIASYLCFLAVYSIAVYVISTIRYQGAQKKLKWYGKELNLAEDYSDPDLVSMRNVAGEIKGAELAMAYCLTHDIPELAIYHDYQGIASWCTREWQAKKQGTIDYRNFYDLASAKVAIRFCKVKGHTGVTYNEKADQLAKQALGL